MAVTKFGKSYTMTANADAVAAGTLVSVIGANFQGTGLTVGQQLKLTDAGGSIIFDYLVEAAQDNADLLNGRNPQVFNGLTLTGPAAGAWILSVILE